MRTFFASPTVLLISSLVIPAVAQSAPKAVDGYSVGVFARSVQGKYTKPDSIAVFGKHVFIGYGDGNDPAGLDGKSNIDGRFENVACKIEGFSPPPSGQDSFVYETGRSGGAGYTDPDNKNEP